ncbi:hypothetical protein SAMN05421504_101264 [Amycolatopsis xylanica]|uniref:Uncharacterized protein n=1 Tax=Amycolatopsis xylanica TaxID=589385 RepID=A0A1H2SL74_9PSEU|nr:hypothetical protein [Amycolatopsis xylanica]SDW32443.1 hypothetical protein SAMN05421504_101264 [Amycolatopsis xylanica]
MTGRSPVLIVVGGGHRVYHEYLLSLMAEHARVWLLGDAEPTWEKLYVSGYTVVDTGDAAAVAEAATRLAERATVDGVSCLDGAGSVACAHAAAALGLPATEPEVVARSHKQDEVHDVSADDLTFDIACVDGEPYPLFVSRRIDAVLPELTGSGYIVDSTFADEETTAVAMAAQRSAGVRYGVTHTRVTRTARGPKVVSVHWGLSGDLVPYAASIADGVNPGRVLVQVALGLRPDPIPARAHRVAAVGFLTAQPDTAIGPVHADETRLPLSVDVAEAFPAPDRRSLRYAYSVVVDDTVAGCARALAAAEKAFMPRPKGKSRDGATGVPDAPVLPDASAGPVR